MNTGTIVGDPSGGRALVTGDAVNTAARLEQAAGSDEVLIGATTRALVGDRAVCVPVEPLELKGKDERVPAWRLVDMDVVRPAGRRDVRDPLLGREDELADRSMARGPGGGAECVLCLVLGARYREVASSRRGRRRDVSPRVLGPLPALRGGDHVQASRRLARRAWRRTRRACDGSRDADRLRFATAARGHAGDGAGDPARRRFTPARARPVDRSPASRRGRPLGRAVHARPPRVPVAHQGVAVVATARPELLEARPDLAREATTRVELPAGPGAAGQLLQGAASDMAESGLERVIAEAEGNPLMILQLVRHLADGGDPESCPRASRRSCRPESTASPPRSGAWPSGGPSWAVSSGTRPWRRSRPKPRRRRRRSRCSPGVTS